MRLSAFATRGKPSRPSATISPPALSTGRRATRFYNLVVIGEAAAQISAETRARAPEIAWTKSRRAPQPDRTRVLRIDLEVIQSIVAEQLETLDTTADRLIEEVDEPAV